jgi:hypothetical protein
MKISQCLLRTATFPALLFRISNHASAQGSPLHQKFLSCNEPSGILCAEQLDNPRGLVLGWARRTFIAVLFERTRLGISQCVGYAACGPEPGAARWERH